MTTYKILAAHEGVECPKEAQRLVDEHAAAFGKGWSIWMVAE